MNGHEREDVMKYQKEIYLPTMANFEERTVQFEGPELMRVDPTLNQGKHQIKPYWHDECCFHTNDNAQNAW